MFRGFNQRHPLGNMTTNQTAGNATQSGGDTRGSGGGGVFTGPTAYGPAQWGRAGGGASGGGGYGPGFDPAVAAGTSGGGGEGRRKPDDAPAIRGKFTKIAIPASYSVTAGAAAWFPIIYLPIDERFADELAIIQCEISQMPCDTAGGGGGIGGSSSAQAWGTEKGEGALVVAGFGLPVVRGAWNDAPCKWPGLDSTVTGAQFDDDAPIVMDFPSGKLSDTAPFKRWTPVTIPGWGQRAGRGDVFSVALVLPAATINAASTARNIYCGIEAVARAVRVAQ
jgi:hypothetical protein